MTDVLIIGAGIAGLYTALNLDPRLNISIATKEGVDSSNSWLAQGGIAAAISKEDSPKQHLEDTLVAGAGLCDAAAVSVLVDEGPRDVVRLVDMRVPFDLNEDGDLAITREGGHLRNRIVHAGGDATGRETVKALAAIAMARGNITILEKTFLADIFLQNGCAEGALLCRDGKLFYQRVSRGVVLCTGGIGQIYSYTTNPAVATGDGIAACVRAGAKLSGMEFVQFHPTTLYDPQKSGRLFLISEAVRGEGGLLINSKGERVMEGRHPLGELAPRDIVSRGIEAELATSGEACVFLDIRSKPRAFLEKRFPTIFNECLNRGIDISKELIPVRPAQHYMVGGISADLHSRSSIKGLYAVGEAASTGVHGANRLASNSMLECLVFGRRAAEFINSGEAMSETIFPARPVSTGISPEKTAGAYKAEIQAVCDAYAGVVRHVSDMETGLEAINSILQALSGAWGKDYWEARNMAVTAREVLAAALARKESAGTHYVER